MPEIEGVVGSKSPAKGTAVRSAAPGASGGGAPTGTRDKHYDLISVLYHATEGAWNYDEYISDAEADGDDELAAFFRDVRDENAARAKRAKTLLQKRLGS